jgi:chloramphenicol O-acetyltransferase type A
MKARVDLATWARREHFAFFRGFSEPFFGFAVELRCEGAWRRAREAGASFYLTYLHAALRAANATPAFALRIEGDDVVRWDRVDVSATVDRDDGTFGFSYVPYDPDPARFATLAQAEIARVRATSGLCPPEVDAAVVHFSAVPWIRFTALAHARQHGTDDASPKMSFGKLFERDGARWLPFSIHAHHAVVDGRDVGAFLDQLQALLV